MSTHGLYEPSAAFAAKAHVKNIEEYRELFREARQDPDTFWAGIAEREIHWFQKWTSVLNWKPPFAQWFVGSEDQRFLQLPGPPRPFASQK